jgi:hypothetical protein
LLRRNLLRQPFDPSRDQWLLNNLRSLGYTILNPPLGGAIQHRIPLASMVAQTASAWGLSWCE